jgi:hypothetical protein
MKRELHEIEKTLDEMEPEKNMESDNKRSIEEEENNSSKKRKD